MQRIGSARPGLGGEGRATRTAAVISGQRHCTTFWSATGKVAGRLVGGWLVKRVDTRRHMLLRPPSWCCDREHLDRLAGLGARGVKLRDEQGRVWTATVGRFAEEGFAVNRGFGEQVALALGHWCVRDARQAELFGPATEARDDG